jgi:hypothetical protein
MALKKDKQKVLNETIADERLEDFFTLEPPAGVERDFHILEKAYRGLQAPDFARFVELFVGRGHNIDAEGPNGKLESLISTHKLSQEYLDILTSAKH